VAYSMGGGEAVRYLSRHGTDRIARLVLAAATVPFPMHTDDNPIGIDRALMDADLADRTADRPRWYARQADGFFGIGLPGVSVSAELREFLIRQCLDCSPIAARELFLSGFTTDLREELRAIGLPTLIVHGDHDVQAPLEICGRAAARLVPRGTLHVYENAAHGLFVTHAERLNEDLIRFVRTA
jgi:non-heme chloroperoxidase